MKTLTMLLILFSGYLAHADTNTIKYGIDLCENVSFRRSGMAACQNWVIDNSDSNIYSVAVNVCVGFNQGPSVRTADCFERAAQWIPNQSLRDQVDLCAARNPNYVLRAQCLRRVFAEKNNEIYEAQKKAKEQSSSTSYGTAIR